MRVPSDWSIGRLGHIAVRRVPLSWWCAGSCGCDDGIRKPEQAGHPVPGPAAPSRDTRNIGTAYLHTVIDDGGHPVVRAQAALCTN